MHRIADTSHRASTAKHATALLRREQMDATLITLSLSLSLATSRLAPLFDRLYTSCRRRIRSLTLLRHMICLHLSVPHDSYVS